MRRNDEGYFNPWWWIGLIVLALLVVYVLTRIG